MLAMARSNKVTVNTCRIWGGIGVIEASQLKAKTKMRARDRMKARDGRLSKGRSNDTYICGCLY